MVTYSSVPTGYCLSCIIIGASGYSQLWLLPLESLYYRGKYVNPWNSTTWYITTLKLQGIGIGWCKSEQGERQGLGWVRTERGGEASMRPEGLLWRRQMEWRPFQEGGPRYTLSLAYWGLALLAFYILGCDNIFPLPRDRLMLLLVWNTLSPILPLAHFKT